MQNQAVISAIELEQLIDRLVAARQQGSADDAALLAALRAQPLRADSLDVVGRLCSLWMEVGDPLAGLAVLDNDGAALLAAAPSDARAELQMNLLLMRLRWAWYQDNHQAMLQALESLATLLEAPLAFELDGYYRNQVFADLEHESLEVAIKAIDVRRMIAGRNPDRSRFQAWDDADQYQRHARVLARHERTQEACDTAMLAVTALANAAPDQDVDASDWYRLGDALIEILPLRLALFEQPLERLTGHLSLPQRRQWEVRMARLAARSLHAQGELGKALELCNVAALSLECDGGDNFISRYLPMLIEDRQWAAAGERAFEHIYEQQGQMWPGVVTLVARRLQDRDDQQVWWPLCAMRACAHPDLLADFVEALPPAESLGLPLHPLLEILYQQCGEPDGLELLFAQARDEAQRRAPQHPWITRLAAVHDADAGLIDRATEVRLLEACIADGAMYDWRSGNSLFQARVNASGVIAALQCPVPQLSSGMYGYVYALQIEELAEEKADELPGEARDQAYALLRSVQNNAYEQGRTAMERYFATGHGHKYDASAHLYSMLCNNLAINYRCYNDQGRYRDAMELHACGIAASPFAEHYHGLLKNQTVLNDEPGIIEAAEQLWHYSAQYGYDRHDPNDYIIDVVFALKSVGRSHESLIWLERLLGWQQEQGVRDEQLEGPALYVRVEVARCLSETHPDNALALWSRYAELVHASGRPGLHFSAVGIFEGLGRVEDALDYCQRALDLLDPEHHTYAGDKRDIEQRLARLRATYQPAGKKWWQVWK